MFLIALLLCGIAGSFCLSWVAVTLIGLAIVPLYAGLMASQGVSLLSAIFHAALGFALLQLGYVLAGSLTGFVAQRSRDLPAPLDRMHGADQGVPDQPGPLSSWLPFVAVRTPPCQADGGPWNGEDDPGYRMRILMVAWLGRGLSFGIGRPYRVATGGVSQTTATRPAADTDPASSSGRALGVSRDRRAGQGS